MDLDELIQKGLARRVFRAKRKLTGPNLVSHITQRAAGKEPLFLEDKDYLYMLADMKEITKKRTAEIYAFCLMPNHVHILVTPRHDPLDEVMRDLFSRYAMTFNRKYERKGHLFAGPYRQAVCLDDGYLLAASLYIHMNPARAGIIDDPCDYRWSSVRLFCGDALVRSFVNPDFVLRLLGGRDKQERKRLYRELLTRSVSLGAGDVMEQRGAVKQLRKALVKAFPSVFRGVARKRQIAKRTGLELLDEEEIMESIGSVKGRSQKSSPETVKARRFLAEQLIARGYKREEIAGMLGVSVKTIFTTLKGVS